MRYRAQTVVSYLNVFFEKFNTLYWCYDYSTILFIFRNQAVQNALRGAQFARNANVDYDPSDLNQLMKGLDEHQTLVVHVQSLRRLLEGAKKMLYPSERHGTVDVPRDLFTLEEAQSAHAHCTAVVEWCRAYINRIC
jgi:hypothetical protein